MLEPQDRPEVLNRINNFIDDLLLSYTRSPAVEESTHSTLQSPNLAELTTAYDEGHISTTTLHEESLVDKLNLPPKIRETSNHQSKSEGTSDGTMEILPRISEEDEAGNTGLEAVTDRRDSLSWLPLQGPLVSSSRTIPSPSPAAGLLRPISPTTASFPTLKTPVGPRPTKRPVERPENWFDDAYHHDAPGANALGILLPATTFEHENGDRPLASSSNLRRSKSVLNRQSQNDQGFEDLSRKHKRSASQGNFHETGALTSRHDLENISSTPNRPRKPVPRGSIRFPHFPNSTYSLFPRDPIPNAKAASRNLNRSASDQSLFESSAAELRGLRILASYHEAIEAAKSDLKNVEETEPVLFSNFEKHTGNADKIEQLLGTTSIEAKEEAENQANLRRRRIVRQVLEEDDENKVVKHVKKVSLFFRF